MKKYVQLTLLFVTIAFSNTLFSQTYLLQEDFEGIFPPTGWTISPATATTADSWTYGPQPGLLSSICVPHGSKAMVSQWATYYPNNTWAFTPGLSLNAGTAYQLTFKQCVQSPSSNKTESLKITVGNQANEAAQTQTLLDLPTLTNTSPVLRTVSFTPSSSGIYYFAFNCYSAANQRYLSIDSVNVYSNTNATTFPSPYCGNSYAQGVEPITLVNFAGINQSSSASIASAAHEDYTTVTGTVLTGQTYPITLKGNTNGAASSYFKVYIDWNKNNIFTDAGEEYSIGNITNSTGTDAVLLTGNIQVPSTATLGTTRMRVVKKNTQPSNACSTDGKGQTEDYSLLVTGVTSVAVNTQNNVPAYITTDGGNLQMQAIVYPSSISQSVMWSIVPISGNASINSAGLVTAQANGNVWAKAVSVADPTKKDSLQITIINQSVPPTSITISTLNNAPAVINTNHGQLALTASVQPASASQSVVWQIVPMDGNATINSSGVVTAVSNGTVYAKAKSAVNSSLQDSILITISNQQTLGLNDSEISSAFSIYPNPAKDMVWIRSTQNHKATTIVLNDITGKVIQIIKIKENELMTAYSLNISMLSSGTYFVKMMSDSVYIIQKFVKE